MIGKNIIQKAGLVAVSILLSLFVAEVVLRLLYPAETKYYVWQPNLKHTFYPDSNIFYGVRGEKHFTINSAGTRGDEFSANGKNYLCIGGSTTECLYLDDKETWFSYLDAEAASIGKSGTTTREHYIQLKYFVPKLEHVKGVIVMAGLNDMMKRLSRDTLFENDFRFTPEIEDSFVNAIFLKKGRGHETTWWRRLALFHVLQKVFQKSNPDGVRWMIQDDRGESVKRWREYRQHATALIDTLPDVSAALNEYERNLQLIYNEAKRQRLKLIFVTQAAMYKDSMSAFEQSLLWMGGIGDFQKEGGHAYYTHRALRTALDAYNNVTEQFCLRNKITCISLNDALPRDTSVFYDDCHFNENGARMLGEYLSQAIK